MIPVDPTLARCIDYFQPVSGDFWKWRENARVIEWWDGRTLCFRPEVEQFLEGLQNRGWPPFSALLLVLAACKDDWESASVSLQDFGEHSESIHHVPPPDQLKVSLLLNRIHSLPKEFRGPQQRNWLLLALFPDNDPAHAALSSLDTKEVLLAFQRGQVNEHLIELRIPEPVERMQETLHPLLLAADFFPDREELLNFLRTSMVEVPKVAELEFPDPTPQASDPPTLLEEMLEDHRTCGMAHLTQRIIAALNIPMQARGSNDMPIGGVSDITNKGNLDRLLLSELANDDLTLMARLANNEALYLRREEPPLKVEKERIVMIDTTLRLWGKPRAFAVSAALACQLTVQGNHAMRGFALGGRRYLPVELDSKEGVLQLMEQLDPHLNCVEALAACLKFVGRQDKEIIFVTGDENLRSQAFAMKLAELQGLLDFLIVVSRTGSMQLYALHQGHRKLHATAVYDLDDLLSRQPDSKKQKTPDSDQLPAFFGPKPSPLYFPAISMRLRRQNCRKFSTQRVVVVTDTRRVLLWQSSGLGAMELIPYLPETDNVYIEEWPGSFISVFLEGKSGDLLKLYTYDLKTHVLQEFGFPVGNQILAWNVSVAPQGLRYQRHDPGNRFELQQWQLDIATGEIQQLEGATLPAERIMHSLASHEFALGEIKSTLNPGYSPITGEKLVSVSKDGGLYVERRQLIVNEKRELEWQEAPLATRPEMLVCKTDRRGDGLPLPGSPKTMMRRIVFPDGGMACFDPRGLVHLRSGNPNLPEVSIVVIVGRPTAAWASDGTYCGSQYFFAGSSPTRIDAREFYSKYIFPILSHLRAK